MLPTPAYAALHANGRLVPHPIERREPGPHDVLIDIAYCGICHTDLHQAQGQFPGSIFPMVPGHEIVGRVAQIGSSVVAHAIGDLVGVGCFVDSCRVCAECEAGEEQFCDGMVTTYNGVERDGRTPTYGGYSSRITVDEHYVLRIPANLDPASAAPLLCAGSATFAPLRHWGVGKGTRLGVVGLGGLGHIAVKLGAAMGAEVTVFSTSAGKRPDALRFGASDFVVTREPDAFTRVAGRFDLILSTVFASIPYDAYLNALRRDGTLVLLGVPEEPVTANGFGLLARRKKIAGSPIGGIAETQAMLEFCGRNGLTADVEVIPVHAVNEAYTRIQSGDVRYRFVIDMASLDGDRK